MLLEETGEVLGVFEAEGVGGLGGGEPTDGRNGVRHLCALSFVLFVSFMSP